MIGMNPVIDFGVYPVAGEPGRYHVKSTGHTGLLYLVDLDELICGWCGCPHFEYKVAVSLSPVAECKHIRSAKAYQKLQRCFDSARKGTRHDH